MWLVAQDGLSEVLDILGGLVTDYKVYTSLSSGGEIKNLPMPETFALLGAVQDTLDWHYGSCRVYDCQYCSRIEDLKDGG